MKVFAPVLMTTPFPFPLTHRVEKKVTFLASKGVECPCSVHCPVIFTASDSPVSPELLTARELASKILKSAGTLSPVFIITTSPTTKSIAGTYLNYPSLMT